MNSRPPKYPPYISDDSPTEEGRSNDKSGFTLQDFTPNERPRERLARIGAAGLSTAELVAILLRTGRKGENVLDMANNLLREFGGIEGLSRISYDELLFIPGISHAKACQLLAAFEMGIRTAKDPGEGKPQDIVENPDSLAYLARDMVYFTQEVFRVFVLDKKHKVKYSRDISTGTVDSSLVRPAEVFRTAITRNYPAIAFAHNHPSGNVAPSPEDIALTRKLIHLGDDLGIEVVDHMIVGRSSKGFSMREKRIAFE